MHIKLIGIHTTLMANPFPLASVEVPWADLAIECGFYDQAHLAKEFRSFSGIDLTTYTATRHRSWANHTRTE